MKSQVIKVHNLPDWKSQPHTIHVKPVLGLSILTVCGMAMLFSSTLAGLGLVAVIVTTFALLMMPDRNLIQFTPEYAVLYNHRDPGLCTIVYWDDLVTWQYEYHPSVDQLTFHLVDGSVQSIEMFRKSAVARYMNQYAPGKEVKTSRRKEAA